MRAGTTAAVAALSCLALTACAGHRAVSSVAPVDEDCSALVLDNDGQRIFACNYDNITDDDGRVFIHKRGLVKTGFNPNTTGQVARWTARYASVVFSLLGYQQAWGGMNERGLAFSTMALEATQSPEPDHRPPLDWLWPQYMLDTCETVDQVIASDAFVRTTTVDHYLFADRFGGVAVIEFLFGQMVAHTGADLCVAALTNSTYANVCAMWEMVRDGGSCTSRDNSFERFCRAARRLDAFEPTTTEAAVAYAFDTLRRIYPARIQSMTRWSLVFDTANLRAYFRTQRNSEIRWVDLARFDLRCASPALVLDVNAPLSGDVAGAFTTFDAAADWWFMRGYLDRWGIPYDPAALERVHDLLTGYPCIQHRRPGAVRPAPG